mgnify:CR=1 FL=1
MMARELTHRCIEVYNDPLNGPLRMCGGRVLRGRPPRDMGALASVVWRAMSGTCAKCYSLAITAHFAKPR